ncbi:MAG: hypothetical protein AAF846_18165 [Chloroflexota bacterium]
MLSDIFRHWRYFVPRFAGYGGVLGGLFGGLTYPIFGLFIGAPYGLLGGIVIGLLMGIGVPIYNRYFAPEDANTYQYRLSFGTAAIVTAITALPLFFIYSLVAGMVTAYITHQYAENPDQLIEKPKHTVDAYQKRQHVFTEAAKSMMHYAKYFIGLAVPLGTIAYTAFVTIDQFTSFNWAEFLMIGVFGTIYGFIVASFVAAINGLFIVMVNRLFFDTNMPKSQYKTRIVPLIGVLTLFLSMIVTFGIGAPFAAIVGALGANKYADWYYEHDEEKAKREDYSHLEDEQDAIYDDEMVVDEQKQIQHYS